MFTFRIGYIQQILRDNGYPTIYPALQSNFADMPKRSFDYEVVERTEAIAVSPYSGKWNDLGTWKTLCTEIPPEFVGSGAATNCDNTHVINELGIPLLTVGLQDSVVIATPDAILVADKAKTASIKDLVSAYENRPMYEERRWGSYRVLDYQKLEDGTEVLTKSIELLPGRNISYQKHMKRSEVWTILHGRGELVLDERVFRIEPGDVVRVHAGQWHAIRAVEKLMFVEVQRGSELIEEDVLRRFLTWEETVAYCETVVGRILE